MTPSGFSMGTILKMNVSRRSCKEESKDNIVSNSNFLWSLLKLNPSKFQMSSSLVYVLCFLGWNNLKHTAISRKVVGKNVHATIWDMINTLFLTAVAVEPTFVAFL